MRRAALILESEKALAKHLGVLESELEAWINKRADCPADTLHEAVDVILRYLDHSDKHKK